MHLIIIGSLSKKLSCFSESRDFSLGRCLFFPRQLPEALAFGEKPSWNAAFLTKASPSMQALCLPQPAYSLSSPVPSTFWTLEPEVQTEDDSSSACSSSSSQYHTQSSSLLRLSPPPFKILYFLQVISQRSLPQLQTWNLVPVLWVLRYHMFSSGALTIVCNHI